MQNNSRPRRKRDVFADAIRHGHPTQVFVRILVNLLHKFFDLAYQIPDRKKVTSKTTLSFTPLWIGGKTPKLYNMTDDDGAPKTPEARQRQLGRMCRDALYNSGGYTRYMEIVVIYNFTNQYQSITNYNQHYQYVQRLRRMYDDFKGATLIFERIWETGFATLEYGALYTPCPLRALVGVGELNDDGLASWRVDVPQELSHVMATLKLWSGPLTSIIPPIAYRPPALCDWYWSVLMSFVSVVRKTLPAKCPSDPNDRSVSVRMLLQQQGKYYDNHDNKQERTIQIDIAMDPSEDEIFYEQHSIKRGRVDDHPNLWTDLNDLTDLNVVHRWSMEYSEANFGLRENEYLMFVCDTMEMVHRSGVWRGDWDEEIRRIVLALQIEGLCNEDCVHYYNKAYNMMQNVSIDYVVGSHRKREDNSMMIFMDRIGQEDEERKFAVMMDDIRWDEDQG